MKSYLRNTPGVPREDLRTAVRWLSYDFETKTGLLFMPPACCTDMSGCIKLFEKIDPAVVRIQTIAGTEADTRYDRIQGEWIARRGNQCLGKPQPENLTPRR